MLEISEAKDVIKCELAKNGDWIVANVETHMPWTV
jgi:hypothetical protein